MAGERKLIEIDESELLNLKGVHDAVAGMLANQESRRKLLEARKIAAPNAPIPEIDAAAPITAALAEIHKERDAWRQERETEKTQREAAEVTAKFQREWNNKKQILREQNWREDGITAVEQFAIDRGIPDLEVAASHYEKLHPPAEPVTPNGFGSWDFFQPPNGETETYVDKLMASRGDDEAAVNRESALALKEYRASLGQRR